MPARTGFPAVLAAAVAVSGCAGTRPGLSDEPTVELVIHNEQTTAITVFVVWQGLSPTRLGVIGTGANETFLPPFRSSELCVATVPRQAPSFSATVPEREPRCNTTFIPIERGDRVDIVYQRDGRVCYLQDDRGC
jgi:hypothetical protein